MCISALSSDPTPGVLSLFSCNMIQHKGIPSFRKNHNSLAKQSLEWLGRQLVACHQNGRNPNILSPQTQGVAYPQATSLVLPTSGKARVRGLAKKSSQPICLPHWSKPQEAPSPTPEGRNPAKDRSSTLGARHAPRRAALTPCAHRSPSDRAGVPNMDVHTDMFGSSLLWNPKWVGCPLGGSLKTPKREHAQKKDTSSPPHSGKPA